MDVVRELTLASLAAAVLIGVHARMKGRLRWALPGLVIYALIVLGQLLALATDVPETMLLSLIRWLGEGDSVLRIGTAVGVPASTASLYPDDSARLARIIGGYQEGILFLFAILGYLPLILSVVAVRYEDWRLPVHFAVYAALVTTFGMLWAHGIGQEFKFFDITWRHGSRGHWVTGTFWIAALFGFPIALGKARESARADAEGTGGDASLRSLGAQLLVMVTAGPIAIGLVGLFWIFRAPPLWQAGVGLVCSFVLQAMLAGAADPYASPWSPRETLSAFMSSFSDLGSEWRDRVESVVDRAIGFLLGTVSLAGFYIVGGLTIMAAFSGEENLSLLLLVGAGAPFLLLIGVPGSTDYLGAASEGIRGRLGR